MRFVTYAQRLKIGGGNRDKTGILSQQKTNVPSSETRPENVKKHLTEEDSVKISRRVLFRFIFGYSRQHGLSADGVCLGVRARLLLAEESHNLVAHLGCGGRAAEIRGEKLLFGEHFLDNRENLFTPFLLSEEV